MNAEIESHACLQKELIKNHDRVEWNELVYKVKSWIQIPQKYWWHTSPAEYSHFCPSQQLFKAFRWPTNYIIDIPEILDSKKIYSILIVPKEIESKAPFRIPTFIERRKRPDEAYEFYLPEGLSQHEYLDEILDLQLKIINEKAPNHYKYGKRLIWAKRNNRSSETSEFDVDSDSSLTADQLPLLLKTLKSYANSKDEDKIISKFTPEIVLALEGYLDSPSREFLTLVNRLLCNYYMLTNNTEKLISLFEKTHDRIENYYDHLNGINRPFNKKFVQYIMREDGNSPKLWDATYHPIDFVVKNGDEEDRQDSLKLLNDIFLDPGVPEPVKKRRMGNFLTLLRNEFSNESQRRYGYSPGFITNALKLISKNQDLTKGEHLSEMLNALPENIRKLYENWK
ncbi:MAG: hypothetical protein HY390_02980 [Deltaproteobacteria bacterium]|nr:hypothetical protein [Deltaproteobacteria bacterium]